MIQAIHNYISIAGFLEIICIIVIFTIAAYLKPFFTYTYVLSCEFAGFVTFWWSQKNAAKTVLSNLSLLFKFKAESLSVKIKDL